MKTARQWVEKAAAVAGKAVFCLFQIGVLIFFGKPFLDFFGITSYSPPLNQEASQVVRVDLMDCSAPKNPRSLLVLENGEKDQFLADFLKTKAKRYAFDPPGNLGERAVFLYYENGCVDCFGIQINEYRSSDGKDLPTKGWFYFPEGTIYELFAKYGIQ